MEEKKIELSQAGMEKLIAQSISNFQEERDLALERYRRQDEAMTGPEDFVMQGKITVEYLKVASERSNAIFGVAKLMKEILIKDDTKVDGSGGGGISDEMKREIMRTIKDSE